jgi:hypothetical protein
MSDIVKADGTNIVSFLHNSGNLDFPKPFARRIYLTDVYIAGTTHVRDIEEIVSRLDVGAKLDFFREADNPHDSLAIVVKDGSGSKLGYIPQNRNEILSRLMDAGKLLYGTIAKKEYIGNWPKITMQVYLDE